MHLTATDRVWLAVRLFWSFRSANALLALMTHVGSIVLKESFEAGEAIVLIKRCTVYYDMANLARAMREHPSHRGVGSARMRAGLTIVPPRISGRRSRRSEPRNSACLWRHRNYRF
jgi:hypothetical protein